MEIIGNYLVVSTHLKKYACQIGKIFLRVNISKIFETTMYNSSSIENLSICGLLQTDHQWSMEIIGNYLVVSIHLKKYARQIGSFP